MVRQEDVVSVAEPVLRHRVIKTFTAESEGVTCREIISRLVDELSAEA